MQEIPQIRGVVMHGKKLGSTLGFPTANIHYTGESIQEGTYKVRVCIDNTSYSGVGAYLKDKKCFEVHIFEFTGDLYEKEISVFPLTKIRNNQKFPSLQALKTQITADIQRTKDNTWTVLTFGTFDHFHEGHKQYLLQASQYGDSLVTIVALDQTVQKVKGKLPRDNQTVRSNSVYNSGLVDNVELGDAQNYYSCLEKRKPQVICLGYDQDSFDSGILDWYKSKAIKPPHIIRLSSYKPDVYKSSLIK